MTTWADGTGVDRLGSEFETVVTSGEIVPFSRTGVLEVLTGALRFRFPFAATILGVSATVGTAPTGSSVIVDVRKNGTTIFTTEGNRPAIAASAFFVAEVVPEVTAIASGDYLTADIDQIGSTIAGADLMILVRYRRA